MRNKRLIKLPAHVCRIILAVTFILSGFTKTVDPWGTALKVSEYLTIYGWDELQGAAMAFSIWLCGAELMMGCMLLFKVRIRMVSIFALGSMLIFTVITLLSATVLPVEDCGCFGEAIKLTPWQTFAKNLIALPMAVVVWWRYRPDRIFSFKKLEFVLMCLFFVGSMSLGYYCYRHLPIVDFLPYKVGVNIHEAMKAQLAEPDEETETVLVYRNRKNGKLREFKLDDTEWQNDEKWEWVDTRSEQGERVVRALISEFSLHNAEGDVTEMVLTAAGRVYMLCMTDPDAVPTACMTRLVTLCREAILRGDYVVCVTPDPLYDQVNWSCGGLMIPCYNIDASTMKTMLRARDGVVLLEDGVIKAKYNCLDAKL